ncbi:hypothetical protein IE53DRAFT_309678 [Violaceomyces palustris]|uniref:Uncharacterized protein n=1 Tax=Violaceomyces palustris TaxID=1673888 RepID=A0ACD0P722_9BASI|nr:hypothetical protein IE53DRAFT_309678 [Violaceomyces palustris]
MDGLTLIRRHGGDNDGYDATAGLLSNTATGDPWMGQMKYTQGIVGAGCIFILAAAILNLPNRLRRVRWYMAPQGTKLSRPKLLPGERSVTSLMRTLACYRLPSIKAGPIDFRLPALGATMTMSAFMLGFTIWAFVVQPYYRSDRSFGSPPLALRTGMMAVGLMPFVYVLGSKVNFISVVTGASHERLQVWHQWTSRFMLFLATIHTIPFIRQPLVEGGVSALREYYFSDFINISGTIAYSCLFFLVFGSFRGLRERWYELWFCLHVPVAIVFLGYMFVHCSDLLTSWRYLWGTAAMYATSVFLRLAKQLRDNNFLLLAECEVQALLGGMTKLTAPTSLRWKPGQHVFIRFPSMAPWSSHPFTMVSLPNKDPHVADSNIVLLARAQGGLTEKLYDHALKAQGGLRGGMCCSTLARLPVIIDGPYGQDASVAHHDRVIFVAGGSGITFAMASLLDLAWQWKLGRSVTKKATLVWSVRDSSSTSWMRDHIEAALTLAPKGALDIELYISSKKEEKDDQEIKMESELRHSRWKIYRGHHPDMKEVLTSFARSGRADLPSAAGSVKGADASLPGDLEKESLGAVICGPHKMGKDASNATASIQLDILRGRLEEVLEFRLVNEHFGW